MWKASGVVNEDNTAFINSVIGNITRVDAVPSAISYIRTCDAGIYEKLLQGLAKESWEVREGKPIPKYVF